MRIFYLFILFAISVNAQIIQGKILSKETNEGLSYISIFADDNNYLTITDSVGNFSFQKTEHTKQIIVDAQGFELRKINLDEIERDNFKIFLIPQIIQLNEVAIVSKFTKKVNTGNSGATIHVDFLPVTDENRIREVAVRLNARNIAKIDKVNIEFTKLPKYERTAFRLTIYDEKDGHPNNIISKQDLMFEINEEDLTNNVYTIHLKDKNIIVNGTFYVAVEIYNELEEAVWLSAGFLGRNGYLRRNYKEWDKMPLKISPYINVELLLKIK